MNILVLTPRFPFPPIGGDKTHIYFILKYLSKFHSISLICFADQEVDQKIIDEYSYCFSKIDVVILSKTHSYMNCIRLFLKNHPLQISYYYSANMQNLIKQQIYKNKFDCIFVHLIRMAEYVRYIPLPKILDMGDAQSLNYIRGHSHRRGLWSIINRVESWRTENYERHIWKDFDKTLVVSPIDAEYLRQLNKQMNVEVMPIGFDIRSLPFRLNKHSNKNICFLGNMRTFPNTDAVIWFCDKIFPLIKEHLPEVEFHIVGAEPSRHVMKLAARKDVYVTGKVDNVNQYVYDASVMVVPMRIGAGIQTKIYESMALGTPVVTTPIGMEGIACTQGKDILIADAPDDFANKVVELIKNKNLRAQISKCARQTAEKNYCYNKLLRKMDNILMSCSS